MDGEGEASTCENVVPNYLLTKLLESLVNELH